MRTKGTFQIEKKAVIFFTIPFHLCVKSVRFSICVSVSHDDGKSGIKKLHQKNNKFRWRRKGNRIKFSSWTPSSIYLHSVQTFFHCFKAHFLCFLLKKNVNRKITIHFRPCPVAQCSLRWFNGFFWPKFYAVTQLTRQMRLFHLHYYPICVQCS